VGYAKATSVHPLDNYDGERASGSLSHMRGPKTKGWLEDLTTLKRMEIAQHELGIDSQAGDNSNVCLFPLSSYRNYL
jgi:hypothetical protein